MRRLALFLILSCFGCCRPDPAPFYMIEDDFCSKEDESFETLEGWIEENWWETFKSPSLNHLVENSLAEHPLIRYGEAREKQGAYLENKAFSSFFPKADLETGVFRANLSKNGLLGSNPLISQALPLTFNDAIFGTAFSYRLDWWGQEKARLLAAREEKFARLFEYFLYKQKISMEVAHSYFGWRAALDESLLLDDSISYYKKKDLFIKKTFFQGS